MKKGVDKRGMGWYSNKAVGAEAPRRGLKSLILKKFKIVLDKRLAMW